MKLELKSNNKLQFGVILIHKTIHYHRVIILIYDKPWHKWVFDFFFKLDDQELIYVLDAIWVVKDFEIVFTDD